MLDKKTIIDLKKSGCSYKEIAEKLGISVGSVKSIISRYSKTIELEKESYKCKYCGNPLVQTKSKKKKEFCSDKCRKQYWKQKNFCKRECLICHKIFTPSYSDEQKYCSKACYLKRSVNGGGSDESWRTKSTPLYKHNTSA